MNEDLWPDIPATSPDSPVAILREQAALLSDKTKGRLSASITLAPIKTAIKIDFYISSARLEYANRLFYAVSALGSYPVKIVFGDTRLDAANAAEFRANVRTVLQAPTTRNLLGILIAQVDQP